MVQKHPTKTEESANQPEGCDAKLQGPERAASCTFSTAPPTRDTYHSKRFHKVQDAERCTSLSGLVRRSFVFDRMRDFIFGSIKQWRKIL